jgi:hypothetical protein
VAIVLSTLSAFAPVTAGAVGFQQAYMRLDRMAVNTATGGTVCATPASTATEGKVVLTFPATYALNTTAANWTVTTTNLPTGATAWIGITTATAVDNSLKTATFTSGDLTVGTEYCFNFTGTSTLTTASGAATNQQANIQTQTSGAVVIDYTNIALVNIANDQIVVTAVVPPSFSFTLSGNTDPFVANLDATQVISTSGRTVSVSTNAKGGWIAWAKDSQQGLHSATANYTIPTTSVVSAAPPLKQISAGVEGYLLDTDLTTDAAGGCTVAIDSYYNGTTTGAPVTLATGGAFAAAFQSIAACTGASPAYSAGDVITLIERASITNSTPAASDYTDIVTVVGAGNF